MQKAKRVILKCLKSQGTSNRFKIRQYFSQTARPTNSYELMRQLYILEKVDCVQNNKGDYSITKKGSELLDLLNSVEKILS